MAEQLIAKIHLAIYLVLKNTLTSTLLSQRRKHSKFEYFAILCIE